MRSKRLKGLIRVAALLSILAVATNVLLTMHISACHRQQQSSQNPQPHSPQDHHNNQDCRICQLLLIGINGANDFLQAVPAADQYDFGTGIVPAQSHSQSIPHAYTPRGPPFL